MQLSPERIVAFHNEGFLAIREPVIPTGALCRLRDVYDRLFHDRAGRADGNQFDLGGSDEEDRAPVLPQILQPDRYAPELRGPFLAVVDTVAKQLLGPSVTAAIFHAILKPAGTGAPTPWHQDEAYWDPSRQYRSISIWMPLQEATIDNGCMWFNRASHEWDVLEHRSIGGDPRVHGLELVDASVIDDPVACPLPPGGIVIHRNRTCHYAGPNVSGDARRALIMGAALPERAHPRERRFPWNEAKRTLREQRARGADIDG